MKTFNDFKVAMLMAGLLGTTAALAASNTQDMTVKAQVIPSAEIVAQANTIDFGQMLVGTYNDKVTITVQAR